MNASTYRRIAVAIDGSETSAHAARVATSLALRLAAVLRVLHVSPIDKSEDGKWLVERVVTEAKRDGVNADGAVRQADATRTVDEILAANAEFGGELLVLGSRGLSDVASAFLGGVAVPLVAKAPCPVLIVPARSSNVRTSISRLLVAIDDDDNRGDFVAATVGLAKGLEATVQVVHVRHLVRAENGFAMVEPDARAAHLLTTVTSEFAASGIIASSRYVPATSHVAGAIVGASEEWDADLVVVGSRHLSDFERLWKGSVSHEVLHEAGTLVLIVPG